MTIQPSPLFFPHYLNCRHKIWCAIILIIFWTRCISPQRNHSDLSLYEFLSLYLLVPDLTVFANNQETRPIHLRLANSYNGCIWLQSWTNYKDKSFFYFWLCKTKARWTSDSLYGTSVKAYNWIYLLQMKTPYFS